MNRPKITEKAYREMHHTERAKVERLLVRPTPRLIGNVVQLSHHHVWREAFEREQRREQQLQRIETEKRARAAAEAEALVQARAHAQPKVPAEMKAKMVESQLKLQEWFLAENKRFRRVFRAMDDDHNGWVDRKELRTLPTRTNLAHVVPIPVLEALIDIMDIDGDGRILYNEFVRVIMADDLLAEFM